MTVWGNWLIRQKYVERLAVQGLRGFNVHRDPSEPNLLVGEAGDLFIGKRGRLATICVALSESILVVEGAELLGDGIYLYLGYGLRAWAESRLGKHKEAIQSMQHAQATSQRLGGQLAFQDLFAAATAELLLAAGRVEEGLRRAETAVELARVVGSNLSEGLAHRVWGQALACLSRWEEAEMHLKASVQVLLSGEVLLEAARSQVAWGGLCRDRGDPASAQGHFEQAAAQFETSGLTRELEIVRRYLAQMGQS